MKNIFLSIVFLLIILPSCKVEPTPIGYGQDHCHFCDMTVVDKSHAAQYTTKKGKSYSFDAIECMARQLINDNSEEKMEFIQVANFAEPGNLIDARTATFLVSDKIKSPMGENLSAFNDAKIAQKHLEEFGGKLYTWAEIKAKLSK